MDRREFIRGGGAIALGASCAGCLEQVRSLVSGGYPGFESIDWVNLDVLRITFSEDHTMDGFGVAHSETDNLDNFLVLCRAPQFSGPIDIPLIDMIRKGDTVYPSRDFKVVAYNGQFSDCGQTFSFTYVRETLGAQGFLIPKSIMPQSKLKSQNHP